MKNIDFLIIGVQKAGTSALHHFINQHPDIFFPKTKEISFFTREKNFKLGDKYLNSYYQGITSEKRVGNADVQLIFFPEAIHRVKLYNPNMKAIASLRNPVERAYSAFWYARRFGWEKASSFEEALEKETERLGGSTEEQGKTYLAHGHYSEQLERWQKTFDKRDIHIILSEDLKTHPAETVKGVFEFLEVTADISNINVTEQINVSSVPKIQWVEHALHSKALWFKRILHTTTSPKLRYLITLHLIKPFVSMNAKPFTCPPMKPDTHVSLVNYYRPWNEKLSDLLDRSFEHWNFKAVKNI